MRTSGRSIDLVANDLAQVFQTEVGEGHDLDAVDVVNSQPAVFGIEVIGEVPQQIFVAAEDLSGTPDRKHASDGGHGSSGSRLQRTLLPLPGEQLAAAQAQAEAANAVADRSSNEALIAHLKLEIEKISRGLTIHRRAGGLLSVTDTVRSGGTAQGDTALRWR